LKKKAVVPEKTPAPKPEVVEVPEPKIIIPKKQIVPPPVKAIEKPVQKTKPAIKMKKEIVPEKIPAPKPEVVEVPEPKIEIPKKQIVPPPVKAIEKPVQETKPAIKMKKEIVPEKTPAPKPEVVEVPEPKIEIPNKEIVPPPPVKAMEKPVQETKPAIKMKKEIVPEKIPAPKPEVVEVPEIKVTSTGFFKGAKFCEECHEGEYKIWKKTKHFTSFRTAHREPEDSAKPSPKKILKNVAGAKRMKRNKTCYLCHYTLEQKDATAKQIAKSGTSCESCHGASSDWLAIHDNYGGEGIMRMDETPAHKKERIAKSSAKGLIWPNMKYQVVENCMTCHGLAHPDLSGDVLAKMLGAGHPINPDFEAVKYSQGTVRHRYTPDDITNNREMTEPEKAELFVIGHAAALVSAREAMSKSNEPKYTSAQKKRAQNAEAVLSRLSDIPEARQLVASPNRSNALKLVNAIAGKDLTSKVGSMLPVNSDYK